jgi:DNA-binding transcriptional LysR family regulator
MPRNLDTALMRSFVAVAETGGTTRAAAVLHLTQAAVSQQVKRLEEGLGRELFRRDRSRMELTAAGERLLAKARRLLAVNDEIWATMAGPQPEGEVRLGVPHDLTGPFLPQLLRAFGRDRPGVRVVLRNATSPLIRQALARDELDLGVTNEAGCDPGGEVLFADPLLWVGAAGGTAWRRDPLPVLLGGPDCAFRAPALEALAEHGRSWEQPCECGDMLREIATLEADVAVGVFLRSAVPAGLAPVPPEAGLPALPAFNVNLYVRQGGVASVVEELAGHIRHRLTPLSVVAA